MRPSGTRQINGRFPFHSLFLAVFPPLNYLATNISQVIFSSTMRLLIAALIFGILVLGITFLILRDWPRAGMITSLFLLMFYSYGHLYTWLAEHAGYLAHHRYLFPLFTITGLVLAGLILRKNQIHRLLPTVLNIMSGLLVIFQVVIIINHQIRVASVASPLSSQNPITVTNVKPDVYYIILDMYARDDLLLEEMGYDNSGFLDQLEKRGFYIARCSLSNYTQTELSLASSMNMDYLDALGDFPVDSTDRTRLDELILHSRVRNVFENLGYKIVSLSAYDPLKLPDADIFLDTTLAPEPTRANTQVLNAFEALFLKTTALRAYLDSPWAKDQPLAIGINYPYSDHIREQSYILDTLPTITQFKSPKFVFVHIQLPHPPFVFTAEGEIVPDPPPFPSAGQNVPREVTIRHYLDQLTYLNNRLVSIIDNILLNSKESPIIILQGDHGPYSLKMPVANYPAILNAYLVPESSRGYLYPAISPVNTFRFIFRNILGQKFDLLPDSSFMSTYTEPYRYQEIIDDREECK